MLSLRALCALRTNAVLLGEKAVVFTHDMDEGRGSLALKEKTGGESLMPS